MAPLPILHPPIAPPLDDEYEMTESSRQAREGHERAVQDLFLRRRAQTLAVPTNDSAVRALLCRFSQLDTLFGEREMERRDRLRSLLAHVDPDKISTIEDTGYLEEDEGEEQIQYPFYTEGPPELFQARVEIANYSLPRANARIKRAVRRRDDPEKEAGVVVKQAGVFELDSSEIGDERPLTGCSSLAMPPCYIGIVIGVKLLSLHPTPTRAPPWSRECDTPLDESVLCGAVNVGEAYMRGCYMTRSMA